MLESAVGDAEAMIDRKVFQRQADQSLQAVIGNACLVDRQAAQRAAFCEDCQGVVVDLIPADSQGFEVLKRLQALQARVAELRAAAEIERAELGERRQLLHAAVGDIDFEQTEGGQFRPLLQALQRFVGQPWAAADGQGSEMPQCGELSAGCRRRWGRRGRRVRSGR